METLDNKQIVQNPRKKRRFRANSSKQSLAKVRLYVSHNKPRKNRNKNGEKQAKIAKFNVARQQERPKEFQRFPGKTLVV